MYIYIFTQTYIYLSCDRHISTESLEATYLFSLGLNTVLFKWNFNIINSYGNWLFF